MFKLGHRRLELTSADIEAITAAGLLNITVKSKGHVVVLELVNDAEAARLVRQEGGLPV